VNLERPDHVVDEIAARAAALVLEQLQPTNGADPKYLSPADAAAYIGKSRQRIYDLLAIGRLTKHKDGSSVLISVAELEDYVAGRPSGRAAR
jgi:excisionase family DNA binding protein